MTKQKYIKNKISGISIGLHSRYRAVEIAKQYAIYDTIDGRIIERIQNTGKDFLTEHMAVKRLYEINGLEHAVSDEIRILIDETP